MHANIVTDAKTVPYVAYCNLRYLRQSYHKTAGRFHLITEQYQNIFLRWLTLRYTVTIRLQNVVIGKYFAHSSFRIKFKGSL